jgi:hypothetical protein
MSEFDERTPTDDEVRHAADWGRNWIIKGPEFDRWLAAYGARVLREAASWMRRSKDSGHWNLRDPQDPGTSYSPDRWLDVRADRIEQEAADDDD